MTVPPGLTRATIDEELVPATQWARRHGWVLDLDADALELRAATYHPNVVRLVEVVAGLEGYPALPPAWMCVTPGTSDSPPTAWPIAGQLAGVSGSVFHPSHVFCAPWNRLAYKEHSGLHADWTMTSWRSYVSEYTKADHLADMLDQIHLHLGVSPGFAT